MNLARTTGGIQPPIDAKEATTATMPTFKTERVLVREALERYSRAAANSNTADADADAAGLAVGSGFGTIVPARTETGARTPTAAGGGTTGGTMTTAAAAAPAAANAKKSPPRRAVGKSARSSAAIGIPTGSGSTTSIDVGASSGVGSGRKRSAGRAQASSGKASKAATVRRTGLAAGLGSSLLLCRDSTIGTTGHCNSNFGYGSGCVEDGGGGGGYGCDSDLGGGCDLGGRYDAGGGHGGGGGGGGGGTEEPFSFWRSPANDDGSAALGGIHRPGGTTEVKPPFTSTSTATIPSKIRYAVKQAAAAAHGRGGVARTRTAAAAPSGGGPRLISPVPGLPITAIMTGRSHKTTKKGGPNGASTGPQDANPRTAAAAAAKTSAGVLPPRPPADRGRVAALIEALERDGHLAPLRVGPADDGIGGTGKGGGGGIFGSSTDATIAAPTAAGVTPKSTPSGGRGWARVSLASSSTSASAFSGSSSSSAAGGGVDCASPPAPGTYRHLLLDRFLPPLGADSSPTNGTAATAATATTGTWPADTAMATDPFAAAATAQKRGRAGRRGRRTKTVARKRPGRGSGGATKKKDDDDDATAKKGDVAGPPPPSLDAYLAGLAEAKLQRAQIRRRALEREEAAYMYALSEDDVDDNTEVEVGKGGDGATAAAGWGYPTTLATDADEFHLAPKHVFGRKYLYELVCDPTTTTGTAKKATTGASTKDKAATGPAKKKRRRVFTVAPKSSSSAGGGASKAVTSTTIREDAADHRVRIRCRHCRDDADCLRPSSLGDSHFYNLLCGWAANHYGRCEAVPLALQARYGEAKAVKTRGRKAHWIEAAHSIGLRNIVDKDGRVGHGVAFAPSAARASELE